MVQTGLAIVEQTVGGTGIELLKRLAEPLDGLLAVGQRGRLPDLGQVGLDLPPGGLRHFAQDVASFVGASR